MSSTLRPDERADRAAEAQPGYDAAGPPMGTGPARLSADEISQISARLRLTPSERLRYLEDMIAFEGLAGRARRVT
ncbi:MAG TPA: hypothetical protein VH853_16810 [Polyangia bacterium]|nr:hypothetical protein [Polyangia bacterium]